jgi:hypothetical protein
MMTSKKWKMQPYVDPTRKTTSIKMADDLKKKKEKKKGR